MTLHRSQADYFFHLTHAFEPTRAPPPRGEGTASEGCYDPYALYASTAAGWDSSLVLYINLPYLPYYVLQLLPEHSPHGPSVRARLVTISCKVR